MPAVFLLFPFIAIRFGLLALLDKKSVQRAAHFAPVIGYEKIAYGIYQLSNLGIVVSLFFLKVNGKQSLFFDSGIVLYVIGTVLLSWSILDFARPDPTGFSQRGIYHWSRNAMYVAYCLYFLSWSLLTQSLVLFLFVLVFQLSAHWIILSEERWCRETFGTSYINYMKRVRRYF